MAYSPVVGGTYRFLASPLTKDGVVWDVTAGVITATFKRPDGTEFTKTGVGANGSAYYDCTTADLNMGGNWVWCLQVSLSGLVLPSDPLPFLVVVSP